MIIKAQAGKVFKRKIDGFIMSNEITLGYDFSTGVKRLDLPEYYEEIDDPTEINDTEALNLILGQ